MVFIFVIFKLYLQAEEAGDDMDEEAGDDMDEEAGDDVDEEAGDGNDEDDTVNL